MTLYLLTSGAHESYSIEGIFTDRARAEAVHAELVKVIRREANDIEEYEADRLFGTIADPRAVRIYKAKVFRDGRLEVVEPRWDFGPVAQSRVTAISFGRPELDAAYAVDRPEWEVAVGFSIESQEHANKLAVEKYQEWIRARETRAHSPAR